MHFHAILHQVQPSLFMWRVIMATAEFYGSDLPQASQLHCALYFSSDKNGGSRGAGCLFSTHNRASTGSCMHMDSTGGCCFLHHTRSSAAASGIKPADWRLGLHSHWPTQHQIARSAAQHAEPRHYRRESSESSAGNMFRSSPHSRYSAAEQNSFGKAPPPTGTRARPQPGHQQQLHRQLHIDARRQFVTCRR
jgi:hypothetical protein